MLVTSDAIEVEAIHRPILPSVKPFYNAKTGKMGAAIVVPTLAIK